MYVDNTTCLRVKGGACECFRADSVVRQDCFMPPWLFIMYIYAVMREVKMRMGSMGKKFLEERRELS